MPEDIFYDEHFTTAYDDVGDVSTVTGDEYVQQTVVTALVENVGLSAPTLQSSDIEQQRGEIEAVVSNHHATNPPVTVTVESVDVDEQAVTYAIETNQASFPLTVS